MHAANTRCSLLALSLALGCVAGRPGETVESEPSAAPPPMVWSELETMPSDEDDGRPEFRDAAWLDPAQYQDMIVGVAHGPSRTQEAERLGEAITELGVPLDDVWAVSADSWSSDGTTCRHDQIVYYNAEALAFASSLRASLPTALVLSAGSDSRYDVIVQLCPRPTGPHRR